MEAEREESSWWLRQWWGSWSRERWEEMQSRRKESRHAYHEAPGKIQEAVGLESRQLSRETSVGGREPSSNQGARNSPDPCTLLHYSWGALQSSTILLKGTGQSWRRLRPQQRVPYMGRLRQGACPSASIMCLSFPFLLEPMHPAMWGVTLGKGFFPIVGTGDVFEREDCRMTEHTGLLLAWVEPTALHFPS